jgi:hypothetical protein
VVKINTNVGMQQRYHTFLPLITTAPPSAALRGTITFERDNASVTLGEGGVG